MASSVVVQVPSYGYTYSFSGVISVQHEFTLKIQTDAESETGTDYVNGARNQPDKVTLTVRESDVGHAAGWSDRMLGKGCCAMWRHPRRPTAACC